MSQTTLFRPTGQKEYELIQAAAMRAFPPRLPTQPLFYPVLNEEYATQIARDWNSKEPNSGNIGYVLAFEVSDDFLARYDVQQAGSRTHKEYWIPAEDVADFNAHIVGEIRVIAVYSNGAPSND